MKHILANFSDILYYFFKRLPHIQCHTHVFCYHGKNNCQATRKYVQCNVQLTCEGITFIFNGAVSFKKLDNS